MDKKDHIIQISMLKSLFSKGMITQKEYEKAVEITESKFSQEQIA